MRPTTSAALHPFPPIVAIPFSLPPKQSSTNPYVLVILSEAKNQVGRDYAWDSSLISLRLILSEAKNDKERVARHR
jgi:hypothetical protein